MGVKIEVDDAGAKAALRRLADAGGDLKPALQAMGAELLKNTQLRFQAQRSPTGVPWKKVKYEPGKGTILHRTAGGLFDTTIFRVTRNNTVEVGTNKVYGPVHQFGATILPKTKKRLKFRIPGGGFRSASKVTIPARPFLGFTDDDREGVRAVIANHLRRVLRSG